MENYYTFSVEKWSKIIVWIRTWYRGHKPEDVVGAIKGITTSTSVTEEGYAADATTVAALNNSLCNIGLEFDFQITSDIVHNELDVPIDLIISENEFIKIKI